MIFCRFCTHPKKGERRPLFLKKAGEAVWTRRGETCKIGILAARFPYDIDGYCDGTEAFVKALEERARKGYREAHGAAEGKEGTAWSVR